MGSVMRTERARLSRPGSTNLASAIFEGMARVVEGRRRKMVEPMGMVGGQRRMLDVGWE